MKKVIKIFALFGTFGLLLSSCVIKQPQEKAETPKTITVTGNGNVTVEPDLIYLKFLVKTMDWNVSKAVEKNAVNTNNVLTAIKNTGIPESDISTSDYSITQDNSNNYPGQYTVKNSISVVIRNTEIAGSVIDVAVKQNVGANGITSFKYGVSDKTTALRQARTLAIQDAQDAASLLAGASGCKIGAVVEINNEEITTSTTSDGKIVTSATIKITYNLE